MTLHADPRRDLFPPAAKLIDTFGRRISYLRVSVTDRCDLRCIYCMSETMRFHPRRDVLDFEEIEAIAAAFIARGVTRLRLTGGEPLVRRDIMDLVRALARHLGRGLDELTLTTNGTRLRHHAAELAEAGIRRINVSLDTLDAERFSAITRRGRIEDVLEGIANARTAGLAVKINMVVMRAINEDEVEPMMAWAHGLGMGLTLIEGMPLGEVGLDRADAHVPLRALRDRLAARYRLERVAPTTGGPARSFRVDETGGVLGFITPMSHNFCESCNRVRLGATGKLHLCLGQEDHVDLRAALRSGGLEALGRALDEAMRLKPKGHEFALGHAGEPPALSRHMSVTGG